MQDLPVKPIPMHDQVKNWGQLNVEPYNSDSVHPYTRTRVILMNGIEVEAALFLHQFARHTDDADLKRTLAEARRVEQQQQKMINWLVPGNESNLEVTLGYEQVAVDLTAWLAQKEPDPYIKAALDFALIEDFDHLYRYANLYDMVSGKDPAKVVGELTEIMPGRPTLLEHQHAFDTVRRHYNASEAAPLTKMHVATIIAAEQQTMNLYMTIGDRASDRLGRGLYLEIAQIEEQHVSHYESLEDPRSSWFEMLLNHELNECWLYLSCMETETDPRIKDIWEQRLAEEAEHLRLAKELMKKHEKRDPAEVAPEQMPGPLMTFQSNKDYVRQILSTQTDLTGDLTELVPFSDLEPANHRYFVHQRAINADTSVPSREVIEKRIEQKGKDYRLETEGAHPVEQLRPRDHVPEYGRLMREGGESRAAA